MADGRAVWVGGPASRQGEGAEGDGEDAEEDEPAGPWGFGEGHVLHARAGCRRGHPPTRVMSWRPATAVVQHGPEPQVQRSGSTGVCARRSLLQKDRPPR